MKKSHRIITALVALLALSGAYLLVRYLPRSAPEERSAPVSAEPAIVLLEAEQDSIRRIRLEKTGAEPVTLVRGEDGWTIQYPHPLELLDGIVDGLVSTASRIPAERLIADAPEDLAQFGLESPAATATVVTADGTSRTVQIGNRAPSGYSYYMKRQGENTVYLVDSIYANRLLYELSDFRDRTIGEQVEYMNFEYLYLRNRSGEVEVVPSDEDDVLYEAFTGVYKLTKPYRVERGVDSEKLSELLDAMPAFTVKEFIDDAPADLAAYGLDRPQAELEVRDMNGASLHLLFGSRKDDSSIYVKAAGDRKVVTVDSTGLQLLTVTPFTLVSKFALIVGIDAVDRIEIETPDRSWTAGIRRTEKTPDGAETGAEPPAEPEVVETFFFEDREVEDSRFRKYYQVLIGLLTDGENRTPRPGEPALTITFHLTEEAERGSIGISLVPYSRDFYQVYRDDGVSEFLVNSSQVRNLIEETEAMAAGTALGE